MSQPFVGEIRMFAGNFAPLGWAFCDGAVLPISQNTALFSLIGTTYGGDGQNTFALPDLRGRLPMHAGNGFTLGQAGGAESVSLTTNQIPAHTHAPAASTAPASTVSPAGGVWAAGSAPQFSTAAPTVAMQANAVGQAGGSQAHDNMHPYLAVSFILSLFGVFPSQN